MRCERVLLSENRPRLRSERPPPDPTTSDTSEPQLTDKDTTSPLSGGPERIWGTTGKRRMVYGF